MVPYQRSLYFAAPSFDVMQDSFLSDVSKYLGELIGPLAIRVQSLPIRAGFYEHTGRFRMSRFKGEVKRRMASVIDHIQLRLGSVRPFFFVCIR